MRWRHRPCLSGRKQEFFEKAMSLLVATLIPAFLVLTCGVMLMGRASQVDRLGRQLMRSRGVALIVFGCASVWFLFKVAHLGEADFGNYRPLLLLGFGAIAALSWFSLPDFLAVRGAAILTLMLSRVLLDAAFMEAPVGRLFMVSLVYVGIVLALYLGTVPFRLRDFFDWLFADKRRPQVLGAFFVLYGLILCGTAFTY